MSYLTSRSQEAAAEKLQKWYKARVKIIEFVVDLNYPLTSLREEINRILDSVRGSNSETPLQVRR